MPNEEVKMDQTQVPRKPPVLRKDDVVIKGPPKEAQLNPDENEGALDDYDQMIFNQFMADENEDEMLAKQLQNEMNSGGQN